MARDGKLMVVASVIWLFAQEAIAAHRTSLGLLLGLLLSFCFLLVAILAVVRVFTEWRERRWRAAIPLAVCVFAVIIFIPLGRLVSRAVFAWSLPSYERIVRRIESGSIPVPAQFGEVREAKQEARLAYAVFAGKDTNGVLTVIFFTEKGFPALHSGYLYTSSGELGLGLQSRLPIREKVRSKWFYVSN
jgi:hypothetical protein